jgi:hypothetical protein
MRKPASPGQRAGFDGNTLQGQVRVMLVVASPVQAHMMGERHEQLGVGWHSGYTKGWQSGSALPRIEQ